MLFVAAAISFWIIGGKRAPVGADSAGVGTASDGLQDGGADLSEGPSIAADFVRAGLVAKDSASDGVLRLLVLGDEQAISWAPSALTHLQGRLAASDGLWADVSVDLSLQAHSGWTAAEAWDFLESGGWESEQPELVLVAFGWHDGARPRGREVPANDEFSVRLDALAQSAVFEDRAEGEHHFYLRRGLEGLEGEHLSPRHHLALLDGIALRAAERGAAVLYVEQPARHKRKDRGVFSTTAARPRPWLATVFPLEGADDVDAFFTGDSIISLSPAGGEQVGRYVGLGVAPAVLGSGS
jgi:hypothetical protein